MNISTLSRKRHALLFIIGFLCIIGASIFVTMHSTKAEHTKSDPTTTTTAKQINTKSKKEDTPQQVVKASKNYKIERENIENQITGQELDKHLKGNLKGLGQDFVKSGEEQNIDPVFLAALAAQETGWGDSDLADAPWNNIGGITCMPDIYENIFGENYPNPGCEELVKGGTKWQKFNSIEDSIRFKAIYLKEYYVENGKETIGEIQTTYAPNQAKNDQSGLNNNWVKNIVSIMNDVKVNQTL
ncbi:glucosaminidase domain-containing protein [Fredinandcohnia humi]